MLLPTCCACLTTIIQQRAILEKAAVIRERPPDYKFLVPMSDDITPQRFGTFASWDLKEGCGNLVLPMSEPDLCSPPPTPTEIMKLTAQFVARNGKNFLDMITAREVGAPGSQFDFLRDTHSHFKAFQRLVDSYSLVITKSPEVRKDLLMVAHNPLDMLSRCQVICCQSLSGTTNVLVCARYHVASVFSC